MKKDYDVKLIRRTSKTARRINEAVEVAYRWETTYMFPTKEKAHMYLKHISKRYAKNKFLKNYIHSVTWYDNGRFFPDDSWDSPYSMHTEEIAAALFYRDSDHCEIGTKYSNRLNELKSSIGKLFKKISNPSTKLKIIKMQIRLFSQKTGDSVTVFGDNMYISYGCSKNHSRAVTDFSWGYPEVYIETDYDYTDNKWIVSAIDVPVTLQA